jgi:hypothetical protein
MDIFRDAARVATRTADATTAAAGAVGGAAINGVIGGLQGTLAGIRNGVSSGSHSTPAAALTLGVIGAAGLVEWPVLLAVGGTALVIHQLSNRSDGGRALAPATPLRSVGGGSSQAPRKSAPRKSTARKAGARKATASRSRTASRTSKT